MHLFAFLECHAYLPHQRDIIYCPNAAHDSMYADVGSYVCMGSIPKDVATENHIAS